MISLPFLKWIEILVENEKKFILKSSFKWFTHK